MDRKLSQMLRGAFAALGCYVVLAGFAAREANSQSVGTRVQIINPQAGDGTLDELRKKIRDLEDRLKELEKQSIEEVKDDDVAEARVNALAEKVARLEAAAGERPGKPATGTPAPATPPARSGGINDYPVQTVRAPFTVLDDDDNIVFRATLGAAGKPRVQVGATSGPHVELFVTTGNGAAVITATGEGDDHLGAYLLTNPGARSSVVARRGKQLARIDASDSESGLTVTNKSGTTVAKVFAGMAGHLEIADEEGETRVAAAVQTDKCGIVRTSGPGGGGLSTAPGVPSSIIRGWLGKK